jgi:hypothetical protein
MEGMSRTAHRVRGRVVKLEVVGMCGRGATTARPTKAKTRHRIRTRADHRHRPKRRMIQRQDQEAVDEAGAPWH